MVTDKAIQGLDGVLAYQDDVIIFGATREEHDSWLKSVLNRLIQRNVSLKATGCKFDVFELEFLGFKINATSCQPDQELLKSLA